MPHARVLRSFLAFAAVCGIPALAGAQTVQGRVLEAGSNDPVPGAIITVVGPTGARAAATLSGGSGEYRVSMSAPGTYTLRVERVGYEASVSAPVPLGAGQTVDVQLTANPRRVQLAPVVASGTARRCGGELLNMPQAAALWDEARKALVSSTLAAQSGQYRFVTETRERQVTLAGRVLADGRESQSSVGLPFRPMAADSLVDGYYVVITPRRVIVNGVDAHAILSDAFLRHHCFGVRDGGAERPGLVGLEFVPLANRVQPDVHGVLWIDRASAELRYVEYGYTGLRFRGPHERLTGRLDFLRLPTGVWVTQSWMLTAPMLRSDDEVTAALEMERYRLWALVERTARIVSVETL